MVVTQVVPIMNRESSTSNKERYHPTWPYDALDPLAKVTSSAMYE
jgi:hypothetical protein